MLACGATLAVAVLASYQISTERAERWEGEVAKAKGQLGSDSGKARQESGDAGLRAEEIAAANAVIRQLALPWEDMFNAFELATNDEVALLSMEPDAKKRLVRVTAESKATTGMLSYIKRLQQSALLDEVVLQKHEEQSRDPDRPIRFVVTSVWKDHQ